MGELGDRLREAREEKGLSYKDVEERTRIQDVVIRSLEEERFDDLPEGTYTKGLLRNYATFLGLDAEKTLAAYRNIHGEASANVPRVLNEPLLGRTHPRLWGGIFLAIMILLICAFAAWYAYNRFYLQRDPWPTSRSQATEPAIVSTLDVDSTWTPDQDQPSPSPTMEEEVVAPTEVDTATQEPSPTAPTPTLATPTPAYTPRPTQAPASTEGIVVQADLTAATYVEVRSDGEEVFMGVLEEGEERSWTAGERIALRVGNAEGISLTVNGVQVGALGASGEVLDVEYTLDNLPEP
ncbi:MAG: RodZ domain-containing protein [Anaerolineales bacterium]